MISGPKVFRGFCRRSKASGVKQMMSIVEQFAHYGPVLRSVCCKTTDSSSMRCSRSRPSLAAARKPDACCCLPFVASTRTNVRPPSPKQQ